MLTCLSVWEKKYLNKPLKHLKCHMKQLHVSVAASACHADLPCQWSGTHPSLLLFQVEPWAWYWTCPTSTPSSCPQWWPSSTHCWGGSILWPTQMSSSSSSSLSVWCVPIRGSSRVAPILFPSWDHRFSAVLCWIEKVDKEVKLCVSVTTSALSVSLLKRLGFPSFPQGILADLLNLKVAE